MLAQVHPFGRICLQYFHVIILSFIQYSIHPAFHACWLRCWWLFLFYIERERRLKLNFQRRRGERMENLNCEQQNNCWKKNTVNVMISTFHLTCFIQFMKSSRIPEFHVLHNSFYFRIFFRISFFLKRPLEEEEEISFNLFLQLNSKLNIVRLERVNERFFYFIIMTWKENQEKCGKKGRKEKVLIVAILKFSAMRVF